MWRGRARSPSYPEESAQPARTRPTAPFEFKAVCFCLRRQVTVRAAACGSEHSVCCAADGRFFGWGWNEAGRLGLGDEDTRLEPVELPLEQATQSKARVSALGCGLS